MNKPDARPVRQRTSVQGWDLRVLVIVFLLLRVLCLVGLGFEDLAVTVSGFGDRT